MDSKDINADMLHLDVDYDDLMDLRVDYAFKLLFTKGDPRLLISLLNAIFANKQIPRVVKSLTIKNPSLERESAEDKLSILDIRAELDDGTSIIIEIHMYGLGELKAKTIRSWARAYGEELKIGGDYADQPPTIAVTFSNGQIEPSEKKQKPDSDKNKIHMLCMIMDREDYTVFTDAMELHYIDMRAFVKAVNEADSINIGEAEDSTFSKWLSVITHKEITNKAIIEDACKEEEAIQMAVSTIAIQGKDKYARQAYQRRQDELYFHHKFLADNARRTEQAERMIEQEQRRAEQAEREIEQEKTRAEQEKTRAEQEKTRAEQAEYKIEQEQRRAEQEQRRAEQEQRRAEQEQRRAEQEKTRAEQEQRRAEQEKTRAEQAESENEILRKKLAELEANMG